MVHDQLENDLCLAAGRAEQRAASMLFREPIAMSEQTDEFPVDMDVTVQRERLVERSNLLVVQVPALSAWAVEVAESTEGHDEEEVEVLNSIEVRLYGNEREMSMGDAVEIVGVVWHADVAQPQPFVALHAVWHRSLGSSFPIYDNPTADIVRAGTAQHLQEFMSFVTEAVGGDTIFAKILLAHLVSGV
jgi:hypothetical protein